MHTFRQLCGGALLTAALVAGSVAVAPAASAAVTTYNWNGPGDCWDAGSSSFAASHTPTSVTFSTNGYAHSHGSDTTITVLALPSGLPIYSVVVPAGGGEVNMSFTATVLPAAWPMTGIELTSSPPQSCTFHSFSSSDTITLTDADVQVPPECSDGVDNDLNGATDYPADPGCASPSDTDEAGAPSGDCPLVLGVPVCTKLTTGGMRQPVAVSNVAIGVAATYHVVGRVDIYRFALPTGGNVTLPCVVLTNNATTVDPCRAAGGSYVSTTSVLYDDIVEQPSVGPSGTLVSAGICDATVTITAGGFGVEDFPLFTIC
jgi:hypothetical protein